MDQYKVGDFVSTDQFICKMPRCVLTGYGHESQNRHFQGGSIFNDDASGLFWGGWEPSFSRCKRIGHV